MQRVEIGEDMTAHAMTNAAYMLGILSSMLALAVSMAEDIFDWCLIIFSAMLLFIMIFITCNPTGV